MSGAGHVDDKIPMLPSKASDSDSDGLSAMTYGTSKAIHRAASDSETSSTAESTDFDRTAHVAQKQPPPKSNRYVIMLTIFSALGGFLFGYDTGVVSGAMILMRVQFSLSTFWQELVISITIAAAACFALIAGFMNTAFGRRITIIVSSILFTLGSVLLAAAGDKTMLLIGRLIVGIGIGLSSMTIPMYIAESAPTAQRGRLVTLNQLFITAGQFVASVVDGIFSYDSENGWRYMLGLASIPAIVMFIGFLWLPESPRWLVGKGKENEARAVLVRLRNSNNVSKELDEIVRTCNEDNDATGKGSLLWRILTTPHVRRALIVGCLLQLFQQICGINTVMYYSATIIKMSGVRSDSAAIWLAALTAGINFLFSFVGLYLVGRVGRKPLTIGSLVGVLMSLLVLAVGFQIAAYQSPDVTAQLHADSSQCQTYSSCLSCVADARCGFCYERGAVSSDDIGTCVHQIDSDAEYGMCSRQEEDTNSSSGEAVWYLGYCPSTVSWIATLGLVLYLAFFAPGMGPMPWTINSEIYPLWARSTCISMTTFTNWIFNLMIAMTFLSLTEALTTYGAFYLYAVFSFIGLILLGVLLPETKGKSLEQVQSVFMTPYCH